MPKSRCIQNIFEQRLTLPYTASNIRETDSIVECMTIPAPISNKRLLPPISIYQSCSLAAEGSPITLLNHQITMEKGIIEQHLRWNGDADDTFKNECDGFEWIEKDTFETHIQDITLNVKLKMELY